MLIVVEVVYAFEDGELCGMLRKECAERADLDESREARARGA